MDIKLLICFGTRPEYIKVKSLIKNISNAKTLFTGQHVDLLKNMRVDYKISVDNSSQNRLNNIVCSILKNTDFLNDIDYVLVQGDTTSAMALAIASYHSKKKVIHLEAGLRTHTIYDPYPEELNRQVISRLATINFCPTELNKLHLIKENIQGKIFVVGNTGLDNISKEGCYYGNTVLITMHRRNNHDIMDKWFKEFSKLAKKHKNLKFIFPMHPNPNVLKYKHLLEGIIVLKPIDHDMMLNILKKTRFVISDSGGLQEEASFLNKKIIICRRSTERVEILGSHGILCKWPKDLEKIVDEVSSNFKINIPSPYGDGNSWKKIVNILKTLPKTENDEIINDKDEKDNKDNKGDKDDKDNEINKNKIDEKDGKDDNYNICLSLDY